MTDLPNDAWSYARDPRYNAPPTISGLPHRQRRRAMVDRDEARRRAYMQMHRPRPAPVGSTDTASEFTGRQKLAAWAVVALVGILFWAAIFAAVL